MRLATLPSRPVAVAEDCPAAFPILQRAVDVSAVRSRPPDQHRRVSGNSGAVKRLNASPLLYQPATFTVTDWSAASALPASSRAANPNRRRKGGKTERTLVPRRRNWIVMLTPVYIQWGLEMHVAAG